MRRAVGLSRSSLVVVLPDTTEQGQRIIRLCSAHKVPVVARGAGGYLQDVRYNPEALVTRSDQEAAHEEQLSTASASLDKRSRDIVQRRWLKRRQTHPARPRARIRHLRRTCAPNRGKGVASYEGAARSLATWPCRSLFISSATSPASYEGFGSPSGCLEEDR